MVKIGSIKLFIKHRDSHYTLFHYHPKTSITWTKLLYISETRLGKCKYKYISHQGRCLNWGIKIPFSNRMLKYSTQPYMEGERHGGY